MSSIIKVDQIQLANGSTPKAADLGINLQQGSVLQTISTGSIARTTTSSSSFTDTNYTLTITPSSASSKILFSWNCHVRVQGTSEYLRGGIKLKRTIGTGDTIIWNTAGTVETIQVRNATNEHDTTAVVQKLDTPGTTDPVTYTIMFQKQSGDNFYLFESTFGGNIVLQEIAG
jgi:hypothetical protein